MRTCKKCGESKLLTEFYRKGKTGYRTACKPCYKSESLTWQQRPEVRRKRAENARAWRRDNPRLWLEHSLKYRFGIDAAEYEEMLEAQSGRCAICGGISEQRLAVDHEHASGRIRGLLCKPCNILLGMARDRVETLCAAIVYLETR